MTQTRKETSRKWYLKHREKILERLRNKDHYFKSLSDEEQLKAMQKFTDEVMSK